MPLPLQISAVGFTPAIPISGPGPFSYVPPGIIVSLSSDAVLTYWLEVTGDEHSFNSAQPLTFPTPGLWTRLSLDGTGPLGYSIAIGMPFQVNGIRARVITWISGTLSLQVVQH